MEGATGTTQRAFNARKGPIYQWDLTGATETYRVIETVTVTTRGQRDA